MKYLKLQEWEIISQCNYNCSYCSLPNFKMELDEKVLKKFMNNLNKDLELFLFGGEPFLHKKISFIINYLNTINQPYVIQSNLSTQSIRSMKEIKDSYQVQGSIHPSEISLEQLEENLNTLKELELNKKLLIRRIDIMYIGKESLKYYRIVQKIFPDICFLLPISGFYENDSCIANKEYNSMRHKKIFSWIRFEENYIEEYLKFRSELWEDQCTGEFSTYGKPCPYDYTLWDSKLDKYNCCYRENTNGICAKRGCFWM